MKNIFKKSKINWSQTKFNPAIEADLRLAYIYAVKAKIIASVYFNNIAETLLDSTIEDVKIFQNKNYCQQIELTTEELNEIVKELKKIGKLEQKYQKKGSSYISTIVCKKALADLTSSKRRKESGLDIKKIISKVVNKKQCL